MPVSVSAVRSVAEQPIGWPVRGAPRSGSPADPLDRFEAAGRTPATQLIDIDVEIDCSSGTYIARWHATRRRAWGGGHVTALRRTRVGRFELDQRSLDDLAELPRAEPEASVGPAC